MPVGAHHARMLPMRVRMRMHLKLNKEAQRVNNGMESIPFRQINVFDVLPPQRLKQRLLERLSWLLQPEAPSSWSSSHLP
jgi:hypothetical protein